jgi:hypothetical protein
MIPDNVVQQPDSGQACFHDVYIGETSFPDITRYSNAYSVIRKDGIPDADDKGFHPFRNVLMTSPSGFLIFTSSGIWPGRL